MRLIGLSIFGTALGLLGVFENEVDYCRILDFRSAFYSDPGLQALDIRMTRPFIGHITLAYIESDLHAWQREKLAAAVHNINRSLGFNHGTASNLSSEIFRGILLRLEELVNLVLDVKQVSGGVSLEELSLARPRPSRS